LWLNHEPTKASSQTVSASTGWLGFSLPADEATDQGLGFALKRRSP
jgi:hypothetical protein